MASTMTISHRTLWSAVPLEPTPVGQIAGLFTVLPGRLGKRLEHMAMSGRIERTELSGPGRQRWAYFRRPDETYEQCEARVMAAQAQARAASVAEQNERTKRTPTIAASTRTEWRHVNGQRVKVTVYVPPVVQRTEPARYFASLRPGNYVSSESAIARASEERGAA